jgi:hypothetical protein
LQETIKQDFSMAELRGLECGVNSFGTGFQRLATTRVFSSALGKRVLRWVCGRKRFSS